MQQEDALIRNSSDTERNLASARAAQLGIAIVTFQSAEIISGCLDSLLASKDTIAKVVVTDNASTDETCRVIKEWAARHVGAVSFASGEVGRIKRSDAWLTLLISPVNGGFAYGTNRSLEVLYADPEMDLFWLVNPDCRIAADTAAKYIEAGGDQHFSLMGGRTVFEEHRDTVQTDGGRVSRWTGVCESVNWGVPIATATFPAVRSLDFITGANCVASRRFIDEAGLMEEDYFLYYEEVDWAFRRGELPLRVVPEATIWHFGGTSIGTGSVGRRPSPFSNYFNYRNRVRFLKRFNPVCLPIAFAYAIAKALQLLIKGAPDEANALIAGLFGLRPPKAVSQILTPEARARAFGGTLA
jgi:hypothetical protein